MHFLRKAAIYILGILHSKGYDFVRINNHAFSDQKQIIPEPDVIFDIGSNRGQTYDEYQEIYSHIPSYYSFEAIPQLIDFQKKKYIGHENIYFVQKAVSNIDGQINFNENEISDTSSLLSPDTDALPDRYNSIIKVKQQITIPSTTLDAFCQENHISLVDILKIDVQGGEHLVLEGAKNLLQAGRIKLIMCECLFFPMYKNQCFFNDIIVFLHQYGYRLYQTYNINTNFKTGRTLFCDAIFLHHSVVPPKHLISLD